jgi:iron(III) transport system permease protein
LTALQTHGLRTWQVARTLGQSRLQAARRAVLPAARPMLAAGTAVVMMEVLTDFATVQYFNVQTVPVGIWRVWRGMGDRGAATELAVLVLILAVCVILIERALRGRARFSRVGAPLALEAVSLAGWRRWAATGICLSVLGVAFAVPVARLLTWSEIGSFVTAGSFVEHLARSATLAGLAAVLCLLVGLAVACLGRLVPGTRWAAKGILVGYALPGTVVAIGVLLTFHAAARLSGLEGLDVLATATIVGVVYAYVVRFVPLAAVTLEASLERVTPSVVMAARTLGARPARLTTRILLPVLGPGMGAALLLVFVHALQEISIVLLLRPFNFDTLSVWIWDLASNSAWEHTGLPALTIIAIAVVPALRVMRSHSVRGGASGLALAQAAEAGVPRRSR